MFGVVRSYCSKSKFVLGGFAVLASVSSAADNDGLFQRMEIATKDWAPQESHKHDSAIGVSWK